MSATADSPQKDERRFSRRSVGRKAVVAGSTLLLPQTATVAVGQTDSGYVELETEATILADTSIQVTIYEDTTGTGSADNHQTEIIDDGMDTVEFETLEAAAEQGHSLWMVVSLGQDTDGQETPELHSATITLPETDPGDPVGDGDDVSREERQGIWDLWENPLVFISSFIAAVAGIGLTSKSMAVASWAGYMTFAVFAISTGYALLENILYVTLVLIFVGFGFKIWRLEGGAES